MVMAGRPFHLTTLFPGQARTSAVLSGLIWVQTVCKDYQHTKPEGEVLIFSAFCLRTCFARCDAVDRN